MKIFARTKTDELVFESCSDNGKMILTRNGKQIGYDLKRIGPERYSLLVNNRSLLFRVEPDEQHAEIHLEGDVFRVKVEDERLRTLNELINFTGSQLKELDIRAPIPGLVVKVLAQPGDTVKKDDGLLVLEAMKMENIIKAPHDSEVLEVAVKERESVTRGQVLVQLKSLD